MDRRRQRGFTLVELLLVLVVIGTLSAVALPRLLNLSTEARTASVEMLAGALRAGTHHARIQYKLAGLADGGTQWLTIDGQSVKFWNGYPDGGNLNEGAARMVDTNGFTVTASGNPTTYFDFTTAPTPSACRVTYTEAATPGALPTITVTTSGC